MQHHTLIAHQFDQAIRQATLSVRFGFGAIVCFCIFGTLASLPASKTAHGFIMPFIICRTHSSP